MLSIELPTCTRDYVISIRHLKREDALTLSYLATRLGADMLGAQAGRRIGRDGFTVCWGSCDLPDFNSPPDIIVLDKCDADASGRATVLALSGGAQDVISGQTENASDESYDSQPIYFDDEYLPVRRHCPTLTLGSPAAPSDTRIYTLGECPYGTAEYIASLCHCPAAYVALGALCRAMGFVPVQLVQRLLASTVGHTEPHMLSNCVEGAFRGYRQVGLHHTDSSRVAVGC